MNHRSQSFELPAVSQSRAQLRLTHRRGAGPEPSRHMPVANMRHRPCCWLRRCLPYKRPPAPTACGVQCPATTPSTEAPPMSHRPASRIATRSLGLLLLLCAACEREAVVPSALVLDADPGTVDDLAVVNVGANS